MTGADLSALRFARSVQAGQENVATFLPGPICAREECGKPFRPRRGGLALFRATGGVDHPSPITLEALLARYLAETTHARDGSLKTEHYRTGCAKRAKHLVKWFGERCEPSALTPDRMQAYASARRSGQVSGREVRTRSVQADLSFLKSALRWATGVFENGRPLLDRNSLATYSPPRERDPRRPLIDSNTVEALQAVAPGVNERLPLLIVLMDSTGRRLSSVLGLRWDDFDFDRHTIHWRPELDKRRRTWITPMPSRALEALQRHRASSPHIGTALVFPAVRDAARPVAVYVAEAWLKRAFKLAGIEQPKGGLWHCFRRKWATERKTYPLRDVAAAGGWSDVQTLLTCYQQPDAETLRAVVEGEKLAQKLAQVR